MENLPSGNGLDNTVGIRRATADYSTSGISFLSFAYPAGNWTFALFRHQLGDLEFLGETQGLFAGGTICCQIREVDQRVTSDLDMVSWGLSTAYRLNDRLDLGLGVAYNDVTLRTSGTMFLPDDDTLESIFGRNSYLPERSVIGERGWMDDADWTLSGGFLWRLSHSWNIGGVYRQGPEIEIDVEAVAGEAVDLGVPPGSVFFQVFGHPVEFPDTYGLGFAYRAPSGRLTISFQWDYIEYSSISSSLQLDDQTIDDINAPIAHAQAKGAPAKRISARQQMWFRLSNYC